MDETQQKSRAPRVLELDTVDVEAIAQPSDTQRDDHAAMETSPSKGRRWLGLFLSGLGGLVIVSLTLWAEGLVRTLFERQPVLGWVGLGLVGLLVVGFLGLVLREVRALMRLGTIDALRNQIAAAHANNDTVAARKALGALKSLYAAHPRTAHGRAQFEKQSQGVMEGEDLIVIAEETIMKTLDEDAVARVSTSARRVSLVTALSPRALVDIAMVIFQCASLTRQIAELYGARPGLLGGLKLMRHMMAHLAVTGGMAATEGLVSQVLGHSLAARLSTRLGEGVINGLLTARVGVAAIAVMRPMPFIATKGPTLSEVTRGMASLGDLSKAGNDSGKDTGESPQQR